MSATRAPKRKPGETGLDNQLMAWQGTESLPTPPGELERMERKNNSHLKMAVGCAVDDMTNLKKDFDGSKRSKGWAYEDLAQPDPEKWFLEVKHKCLEDNHSPLDDTNGSMGKDPGQKNEPITRQDEESVQLNYKLLRLKSNIIALELDVLKAKLDSAFSRLKMDLMKFENQRVERRRLLDDSRDMREERKQAPAQQPEMLSHHNCGPNILNDLENPIDRSSNYIHPDSREEIRSMASRWRRSSM